MNQEARANVWREVKVPLRAEMRADGARMIHGYQRKVSDGHLSVIVANEPEGWHLSISHRTNDHPPQPGRYPTWDEIADARYDLLPDDITVAMLLPPRAQYVNVHPTTFHLHEVASVSDPELSLLTPRSRLVLP